MRVQLILTFFILGSNDGDRKSPTESTEFIGKSFREPHAIDQQQQILEILSLIDLASESMCFSDIYKEQIISQDNIK